MYITIPKGIEENNNHLLERITDTKSLLKLIQIDRQIDNIRIKISIKIKQNFLKCGLL